MYNTIIINYVMETNGLALYRPVLVGNEELYFVTRANTAEGPKASIDPLSKNGWEGEIGVGKACLYHQGLIKAPFMLVRNPSLPVARPLSFFA